MSATTPPPPGFTATNLALFGVLQDLAAANEIAAADAWLRASCDFAPGTGTSTVLTVTAYDAADRLTLTHAWPTISAALGAHVGHDPDRRMWASTPVSAHLSDELAAHPVTPDRLLELTLRARDLAGAPGFTKLDPDARATLPALSETLAGALHGARVLRAGSASCGDYQLIALSPTNAQTPQQVADTIRPVSYAIFRTGLGGNELNNLSPVVADITTATLADALGAHIATPAAGAHRVGVLTPGGRAAPQDVLSKLTARSDLEVVHTEVYLRSGEPIPRRVVSGVDNLVQQGANAIVIGFGGGQEDVLRDVHNGVATAVSALQIPVYVGIGHHDFAMLVPGAHVRTCTTPADATSLFIAEALDAPRRRAQALARSSRDMAAAGIDADAHIQARAALDAELTQIEHDLTEARARHLQP
ncbi:exodeoxyribonuclease VII large subunit [Cellulomonas cellasea]|uniref:Exonuclease VII large subunit C-terminal domain-containing protein n=1 Tax=Cellulomonas cellasea TaxID=43670 RepID=A0A7W4YB20_9CELL|nr:exodeoxyribonuclease VII large subunit [Cellulomonas cellasea]MBB2923198.1 hypothetical protein [Cellulomonas cellasea]